MGYSFREIDGLKIYYRDMGKGPVVFAFPGWTMSSASLVPLAKLLKNFRFIIVDVPGWAGKSDLPKQKATITYYSKVFAKFVSSFLIDNYSFLGHSFGGAIAMSIIKNSKLKPKKLVLSSSLYSGEGVLEDKFFKKLMNTYETFKKFLIPDFLIQVVMSYSARKRLSQAKYFVRNSNKPIYQEIKNSLFRGNVKAMLESGLSILEVNCLSAKLKKFPVLTLCAERDFGFNKLQMEDITKYTNSKLHIIKG